MRRFLNFSLSSTICLSKFPFWYSISFLSFSFMLVCCKHITTASVSPHILLLSSNSSSISLYRKGGFTNQNPPSPSSPTLTIRPPHMNRHPRLTRSLPGLRQQSLAPRPYLRHGQHHPRWPDGHYGRRAPARRSTPLQVFRHVRRGQIGTFLRRQRHQHRPLHRRRRGMRGQASGAHQPRHTVVLSDEDWR